MMSASDDIPGWLLVAIPFATSLVAALAALGGVWLTNRHQLRSQSAARAESRKDQRRERRDANLDDLVKTMGEFSDVRTRQRESRRDEAIAPESAEGFLISLRLRGLLARIRDEELTLAGHAWARVIQTYGLGSDPAADEASERQMVATTDRVNNRIGELLNEP